MPFGSPGGSPSRVIIAADADASATPPVFTTGAIGLTVGGVANVPGATIMFRVISTDSLGNVQGVTPQLTLKSSVVADWKGDFLGSPDQTLEFPCFPICAAFCHIRADFVYFPVQSPPVTNPSWTICAAGQWPVGVTPPWA